MELFLGISKSFLAVKWARCPDAFPFVTTNERRRKKRKSFCATEKR